MDRRRLLVAMAAIGGSAAGARVLWPGGKPATVTSQALDAVPSETAKPRASATSPGPSTDSATPSPTATPSPSPSVSEPTASETAPGQSTPTPEPTPTAQPPPAAQPTSEPTAQPMPEPTAEPTPTPQPTPTPAAGVVVVQRICRDALGLRPAGEGMRPHAIGRLTVHHSAVELGSNTKAPGRLRGHQRYHQDSAGWADIAYHLGVDRNGNLYELRDTRFAGDTFTDYDPAGHFLVLSEGDFNKETPSDNQLEAIARALAWGAVTFGASTDTISGHRDHASTTCPGDRLYGALPDVRARAAQLVAEQGVRMDELCGEPGRGRVADIEAGRA